MLFEGEAAHEGEDDSCDEVPADQKARYPEGVAEAFDDGEDAMVEKEKRGFSCDGGGEVEGLCADGSLRSHETGPRV